MDIEWPALTSYPFMYVIAISHGVVPEVLLGSYEKLQHEYRTVLKQEGGSYLGKRPASIWSPPTVDQVGVPIDKKFSVSGVQTVEASLELEGFRRMIRAALARSSAIIEQCFCCSVNPRPNCKRVSCRRIS